MKLILGFVLGICVSYVTYATFTTRDGVVLMNCTPKIDGECKSQCESMATQNQLKTMGSSFDN